MSSSSKVESKREEHTCEHQSVAHKVESIDSKVWIIDSKIE